MSQTISKMSKAFSQVVTLGRIMECLSQSTSIHIDVKAQIEITSTH